MPKVFSEIVVRMVTVQQRCSNWRRGLVTRPPLSQLGWWTGSPSRTQARKIIHILCLVFVFLAGAGPGTNQNTSSLHKTRSRDRSAGPSLRLAAAGCQFGCSRASTKIGKIRDANVSNNRGATFGHVLGTARPAQAFALWLLAVNLAVTGRQQKSG